MLWWSTVLGRLSVRSNTSRTPTWGEPVVDYDDDPFGVQYWVMRWTL